MQLHFGTPRLDVLVRLLTQAHTKNEQIDQQDFSSQYSRFCLQVASDRAYIRPDSMGQIEILRVQPVPRQANLQGNPGSVLLGDSSNILQLDQVGLKYTCAIVRATK